MSTHLPVESKLLTMSQGSWCVSLETLDVLQLSPAMMDVTDMLVRISHLAPGLPLFVLFIRTKDPLPINPLLSQLRRNGVTTLDVSTCGRAVTILTLSAVSSAWLVSATERLLHGRTDCRVFAGVSSPFVDCDFDKWHNALEEAIRASNHAFYTEESVSAETHALCDLTMDMRMQLLADLVHGFGHCNIPAIHDSIRSMFSLAGTARWHFNDLTEFLAQIVISSLAATGLRRLDAYVDMPITQRHWKRVIAECASLDTVCEQLICTLDVILGDGQNTKQSCHSVQVASVMDLIRTRYDEELDVCKLAAYVYLSPSYLSKRFKQETGMTLRDYIVETRIQRAKELLVNDMGLKAYEVGAQVGYSDPTYFNKLFKRKVGVTPKTYRDKALQRPSRQR